MARVLLLDAPGWQGAAEGQRAFPNVGLAYLIPGLIAEEHEVSVLDLNNEALADDETRARARAFAPDLIGISIKTATVKHGRRVGRSLRAALPGVTIVVGGPHVLIAGPELEAEDWIDHLFAGEAEETLPAFLRERQGPQRGSLPRVVAGGDPRFAASPRPQDLDALPFPDFSLFPPAVRASLAENYPLVTSRGCVYKCVYCSVPLISGRGHRRRSIPNIIAELRQARDRYGVRGFQVIDDVFNLDMNRCKDFCRELIASGLALSWSCPNGIRVDRVDPELAGLMRRSGCAAVMVGVESADPAVLAAVNKGETVADIERGIGVLQAAGIEVGGFFLIGAPGDSIRSQEISLAFVKRTGIRSLFNMVVPYPGTELWQWAQQNARFLHDLQEGVHFSDSARKVSPVFETDDFPAAERVRAYEMVHTRTGQFGLLIPADTPGGRAFRQRLRLLWQYDRPNLFPFLAETLREKLKSRAGRSTKTAGAEK